MQFVTRASRPHPHNHSAELQRPLRADKRLCCPNKEMHFTEPASRSVYSAPDESANTISLSIANQNTEIKEYRSSKTEMVCGQSEGRTKSQLAAIGEGRKQKLLD